MAERIIGVDFGTSTSVIRVKRYDSKGNPLGERLDTREVTFSMGRTMLPTVIQRAGGATYYGYEALVPKRKAKLFQNFKMNLESKSPMLRMLARKDTEEFFRYMAAAYHEQSRSGHLGEADDEERTIVSYPVKWSQETSTFLLEAARKAGFPNVEGMDEAQAAIQGVLVQSAGYLFKQGYLKNNMPTNILLIDMGAGTTDLVLTRYTQGANSKNETLCTWPKQDGIFFGGREVDVLLARYISKLLPEDRAGQVLANCGLEKFKDWKERLVSPTLLQNGVVQEFGELDSLLDLLGINIGTYSLNRSAFEEMAQEYLKLFSMIVNGCIQESGLKGKDVDLVILTGGHSQWYFVKEMLGGELKGYGSIFLMKIITDKGRIIHTSRPHETVALGLVYGPLAERLRLGDTQDNRKYASTLVVPGASDTGNTLVMSEKTGTDGTLFVPGKAGVKEKTEAAYVAASEAKPDTGPKKTEEESEQEKLISKYRENGENMVSWVSFYAPNIDGEANSYTVHGIVAVRSNGRIATRFMNEDLFRKNSVPALAELERMRGITAIFPFSYGKERNGIYCLKEDGSVITTRQSESERMIRNWKDIVTVVCKNGRAVALRKDNTVEAKGWNKEGQCNVGEWKDIIEIACGERHTVGLKRNGTVVAVGDNKSGQCNVKEWGDIISIVATKDMTFGIRKDGRVEFTGWSENGESDVSTWRDIVSLVCSGNHVVGLRGDGLVEAVGNNDYGQCDIADWGEIEHLSCSGNHTVGLRTDGLVMASGSNEHGQCKVNEWEDIIAVKACKNHTIGITLEGNVVYTSYPLYGLERYTELPHTETSEWTLF